LVPAPAQAVAAVTVETVADLQTAVSGATEDTVITLGATFPQTLPSVITLNNSSGFAVEIDGAGAVLTPAAGVRHMVVNASAGSLTIRNLTLTQSDPLVTYKGIQVNQTGAATVTLSGLDFVNLKSGTAFSGTPALSLGGAGTGQLTVENSSFVGSEALYGSAIRFNRTAASQQTLLKNLTVDSNVGLLGSGYSSGAMLIDAGTRGTIKVESSAFLNNEMVNGQAYAHGGAISMHNSAVQLYVNQSYFMGNKVASTTDANADGGALSVFSSTVTNTGSLFVSNSTFEANQAEDDGAALFIEGRAAQQTDAFASRLEVSNSTFVGNLSGNFSGDTGGAIQGSLRANINVDHSTFVGDIKSGGAGGIDIGGHLGFDGTYGLQSPKGQITNSIFTRDLSVATSFFGCSGNVGCDANASTVAVADEPRLVQEVFGTAAPAAAVNDSPFITGDSRAGKTMYPLTTVAIAPPFTSAAFTAYEKATQASTVVSDQRGIAQRSAPGVPDAGSVAMGFVKYDANGGSWSGLTSTFPLAGGSYVEDESASSGWFEIGVPGETNPGSSVPLPATNPTPPAGQAFLGWFTAPVGGTQVTAPVSALGQTLYAQFAAVTHTVTFDSAGGSAVSPVTDVPEGDVVAKPSDPTRSGFTFAGWTLNGVAYDFATPVTADITLVAQWDPIPAPSTHTVTFDSAGGSSVAPVAKLPDGDVVAKPSDPTRSGFTFAGWTLNGVAYDFATPVTADITLVATWKKNDGPVPVNPGGEGLSVTGAASPLLWVSLAAGLLAVGAGLAFVARKRRRSQASDVVVSEE
jgi:uncharacterized repeat protein (TIGR02543 family)